MTATDASGLRLVDVRLTLGRLTLGADLTLTPGAMTAVIGPSGSGKSTLLSLIAGFLTPDAGTVHWNGSRIDTLPPGQRPVSVLFQDNNLFPHLTVAQNIGLAISPRLRLTADDQLRIKAMLDQLDLGGMEDRKPSSLSGGQQSRVALGRVLLSDRPVVLLDEPFAALGPGLRQQMLALAEETLAGRTVLMVSHDPGDALTHAAETIFVTDGMVRPPQPTRVLFDQPPPELSDYLGKGGT